MKLIGGTLICHNPIRYDYCIEAAIRSLVAVCDEVIVLDCQSDDGTPALLRKLQVEFSHLYIFQNRWDVAPNFERLSRLTNIARDYLDSRWHLNLQADEVLHEESFSVIRQAVQSEMGKSFSFTRLNFWGDQSRYFRASHKNPPCSPSVIRLALREIDSVRDAESLEAVNLCRTFERQLRIFHYGFIRDRRIHCDKIINMQQWFGLGVDQRVVKQKREKGAFDPWEFFKREDLERYTGSHPKFAQRWLRDHALDWR